MLALRTPEPGTAGGRLPDRRFEPIDQAVASARTRVLSVDVFDTLLWRRVPKPTDVHLLVGRRLADTGALASHIDPRAYARLRILAEEEARRHKQRDCGSVEVTLSEIHAVLAPNVMPTLGVVEAAGHELAIEQEVNFADRRLAGYLQQVRAALPDLRLIAVSDTYFSAAQLRSLFAACSLGELPLANVYTSSDHGTGKGDELWKVVVEDLRIEPDELVHLGDNPEADVACAQRVGVRAVHYPMSTDRYLAIDIRERVVGQPGDASMWCDQRAGDGGLSALRRRATFLPPPRPLDDREQVAWETGTAVLGPVFTGFAQWVRERAARAGAERVVCLMREGRFLKSLIDRAEAADGGHLRTDTAWASREACARAAIYEGSEGELRSFLARLRAPSPGQILESFGLEAGDVPELDRLTQQFEATNGAPGASEALVDLVLGRPALVGKVVARSAERRRRLVAHFEAAAGPGSGPVMIVDVGWSGTIQECLQGMLCSEGSDLALHGLYLVAHVGAAERVLRGTVLEGFLGDVGTVPFDVAAITGGPELVELVCMCDDGSLLEITEDGTPVLGPVSVRPEETASRDLVQAGIDAYQAEWLGYRRSDLGAQEPFEITPAGTAILGRILKRFLSQPNRDEAETFSWWEHEENFGSRQVDQLVPQRFLPTLRYRTAENLHWAPMSELYWVGGAAALVDNEMADSVVLMREGTVDPGRFSAPSEAGDVRIILEGPGGAPQLAAASLPVASNRQGLSLVEWSGPATGLGRVVVQPSEHSSLLRLDLFEVVTTDPGGALTTGYRWQHGDDQGRLPTADVRWAAPGVLALDANSALVVDLPTPILTGELRVALAGAYLPMPGGWVSNTDSTEAELRAVRRELDAVHQTKLFRVGALPRHMYGALRHRFGRHDS
jgi:FMN phosphatase YigB (HAD superfamily)